MKDVIYVPVNGNEALRKRRLEVVQELVDAGWARDGHVEVADIAGTEVTVVVLTRPMISNR